MGATPIAGRLAVGGTMKRSRRNDPPVVARRREMAEWGCYARPSLMPTIFAPSGGAPADSASKEVAARKV